MKKNYFEKNLVWLLVFVVLALVGTTAQAILVTSFSQIGDFSTFRYLYMDLGDNLLIRVGGVDLSVVEAGYGSGYWHIGFLDEEGSVIGWAMNSAKNIPGREGRLVGRYSYLLGDGNHPINAVLVYDSTNNGWHIENGVVGSAEDLLSGDKFYWTDNLLFDGILGGIHLMDPYTSMPGAARICQITVLPEPTTIAILSLGGLLLLRKEITKKYTIKKYAENIF